MKPHKKSAVLLSSMAIVSVMAVSTPAFAATETQQETLVQRLVRLFKLDQQEVDKVVTQFKSEKQAMMQQRYEERLNTLVTEGKITPEQKTKIMAKHEEMLKNRPNMENWKNMTREQIKAEKQAKRAELENWAKENGIDPQYLMMGMGKNGGMGKGFGHGGMTQQTE